MGNAAEQCTKPSIDRASELDICIEAERLVVQNEALQQQCRGLERSHQELQALTEELLGQRDLMDHSANERVAQVEAQAAAAIQEGDGAIAEAARLRDHILNLEQVALQVQDKVDKLEQDKLEAKQVSPAGRDVVALQAERRALLTEKEGLEETLAETRGELSEVQELVQQLQHERAEIMVKLAAAEGCLSLCDSGSIGQSLRHLEQTPHEVLEVAELQAENAALVAQCQELALKEHMEITELRAEKATLAMRCQSLEDLAEDACVRAEQACHKFEQAIRIKSEQAGRELGSSRGSVRPDPTLVTVARTLPSTSSVDQSLLRTEPSVCQATSGLRTLPSSRIAPAGLRPLPTPPSATPVASTWVRTQERCLPDPLPRALGVAPPPLAFAQPAEPMVPRRVAMPTQGNIPCSD